ncbi:hypothetical protein [Nostoc sp. LEGE 12450]|uniref:hypothetical protein n=1 Tax=Nostoc sp. LEGE 12450 TaxID=1828643 RepID=UPI00187E445E|nr:hypothetical protein [Nostoc sp. LEGE 12450]MBE8992657.1 hypothetical protein [Nostoc sp. LEGE 12450]
MNSFSKSIRQELGDFLDSCRLEGELWMFPPIGYLLLLTTLLAVGQTKLSPATTYLKWLLPVPFATLTGLQINQYRKSKKSKKLLVPTGNVELQQDKSGCESCAYFHGRQYDQGKLICAVHPRGSNQKQCPDYFNKDHEI